MYIIFNGTNRKDSTSLMISKLVIEHLKKNNQEHFLIDLQEIPQDLISPDNYQKPSKYIKTLESKINKSLGIIFVVPEYNGSFPGILKYIIDLMNPSIFKHKPTHYIGVAAGMFGSLRSVEQLQLILQYRGSFVFPTSTFFIGVDDKLNEKKTEIIDTKTKEKFYSNLNTFVSFADSLN